MSEPAGIRASHVRGGPGGGPGGPGRFAEVEKAENVGETIKRLALYFAQQRNMLIAMVAVVIIGTVFSVLAPSLQATAIDIIAGTEDGYLPRALLLMLTVYILYGLTTLGQSLLSAHLSQRTMKRMREDLFDKIIDLPVRYLDTHSYGDVMSRMTNDIENISNTISQSLTSLFAGVLTVIGTVAAMAWYCWQLTLIACVTVVMTLIATRLLSSRIRKYSRLRQSYLGELNGTVEEIVSEYRTVVSYNHQEATVEEFEKTADDLTRAGIAADSLGGIMGPIMNCIGNIGFVLVAAFGGYFALHGIISVGVISAFIVYARQFSRPIEQIAQVYGQLQTAVAGAERVFAVMDADKEDTSGTLDLADTKGNVTFEHVNFSYEPGHQVLHDFSLTIPSGKKVALVGATGSGKTTVVNLLMRFYRPDSGRICIDGKDIWDIPSDELRHNISIVLQDTVLFTDTVRNNLKYFNENADEDKLVKAADMGHCLDMIDSMPDGFDTMLTESGSNISQGQRQLLAIARSFAADPAILILDEATSSVDTRTEKNIQDAMVSIMQDRTSIIIAHRLSTIRDADLIIVMDQGRIVERGTHEELLEKKGKYYELYMTQYAGFAT